MRNAGATVNTKDPLPAEDDIRRRVHHGVDITANPTVSDYLTGWLHHLAITEAVNGATIRGYESIIRAHLLPHLGHIPLDKLRVPHVRTMIEKIIEHNQVIETGRTSTDCCATFGVSGMASLLVSVGGME